MSQTVKFRVNKAVLIWAIHESQKSEEEIKTKFPKISEWIEGIAEPTLKQIEALANYLKIPFGYMFLTTPPQNNAIKVEFRTIDNKLPNISKNLRDTLMEMDRSQAWMREYRENLGWNKLDIINRFTENIDEENTVEQIADYKETRKGGSGGDFYKTYRSRMSSSFVKSVVTEAESGNLSYTQAFRLLGGIKGSAYNEIKGGAA